MRTSNKPSAKSATSTKNAPASSTKHNKRGPDGRFASVATKSKASKPSSKTVKAPVNTVLNGNSIRVYGDVFKTITLNPNGSTNLTFKSSPKKVQTFKKAAWNILLKAAQNGMSLGHAYNTQIRGKGLEISTTIYV